MEEKSSHFENFPTIKVLGAFDWDLYHSSSPVLNLFTQVKSHFSDLFASLQMFDGLSPIIYRFTASILSSSLSSILHHNGCVNGYVIRRLSDVLTLYLSNETLTYVLSLSKYK